MPDRNKSSPETSGRRFGQSPDTCHVAIADVLGELIQTKWLSLSIHNGPHERGLENGSWYHSYEKYGAEVGRFINLHACYKFRMALREELGE